MIKMVVKKGSMLSPHVRKRKFKQLQNEAYSRKLMTRLAKFTVPMVYKRVKNGWAVRGGIRGKFLPLSPEYVSIRKGKRKIGKKGQRLKSRVKPNLGAHGSPSKSNLTWTGQMLENIGSRSFWGFKSAGFKVFIKKSSRTLMGGGVDKNNNNKIAEYVSKKRPFLNLSKKETRVIISKYKQHLKDVARKIFN